MDALHMRLHPGVRARADGTWRQRYVTAHLSQGQLDNACGLYALMMAMLVLRISTSSAIKLVDFMPNDALRPMWNKARGWYFVGTDAIALTELLDIVPSLVSYRVHQGSTSSTLAFAQGRLTRNEVVIVAIGPLRQPSAHWILAVGDEVLVTGRRRAPTALLCLDSAETASDIAPYNARIELDLPSRTAGCRHYRLSSGSLTTVRCTAAISIAVRKP